MHERPHIELLQSRGYKDTLPRRMVLEALNASVEPLSPYDIQKWIAKKYGTISPVTVYRIIELLQTLNIVHKHLSSGKFILCKKQQEEGLHGFLQCHECGSTEEFCSQELSDMAKKQAAMHGFKRAEPIMEIIGSCLQCSLRS